MTWTPLIRFLRDESGTAAIEFIFVFPIIFLLFTASFESSMYMVRAVMLERAVDQTVRKIRLGLYEGMLHQQLKQTICESGLMISSVASCVNSMRIWMQPINTGDFAMVAPPRVCVDSVQDINTTEPTADEFAYGGDNDIMLMRICLKETPMFPTTAISVKMPVDADGTYALATTTVFVNEPG
jgi:hypothetical protein